MQFGRALVDLSLFDQPSIDASPMFSGASSAELFLECALMLIGDETVLAGAEDEPDEEGRLSTT